MKPGPKTRAPLDLALEKIEVGLCWEWTGYKLPGGYGQLGGRVAHRVVYEGLVGPVPIGMELDHLCRNRSCVDPDHLEPVPHLTNVTRSARGAGKPRKTHCVHGHEFTADNTRINSRGHRECRTCRREQVPVAQRRFRARRRNA